MRPHPLRHIASVARLAAASALALPTLLAAQPGAGAPVSLAPRVGLGVAFTVAQPVRDFRRFVPNGWGGAGNLLVRLDGTGAVAMRVDAGLVNYGSERRDLRDGRFDDLYVRTRNDIFWAAVGPQLTVPTGPVRPYVNGQVGVAVFTTSSTLRRDEPFDDDDELDTDNEETDATWAWGGGGGVLVRLSRGVALDLGARYHRNGRVTYLREGGVRELPDGSVVLDRLRSAADLWTYHVGISLGWTR